ncbi:MAG TPA: class I SAM-dependent methyltransferase [Terriglobia bacterium]|nr:class I SAM-dependent methyltransferase [Terriglobia bacterium]
MGSSIKTTYWSNTQGALDSLRQADSHPHRADGEGVLLELIPTSVHRVLDLSGGDGRLVRLLQIDRPQTEFVAFGFPGPALEQLRKNLLKIPSVDVQEALPKLVAHDLICELPDLGRFDAVVCGLALHELELERQRELYQEVYDRLTPGGIFANLSHVASPSFVLHELYLQKVGKQDVIPRACRVDVQTQLRWLEDVGFVDVDCYWKWLELALVAGAKP